MQKYPFIYILHFLLSKELHKSKHKYLTCKVSRRDHPITGSSFEFIEDTSNY